MENNTVEIIGTTSQEEISKYNIPYPYKEFCQSYTISLVNDKPKIGQILKVYLKPEIKEWKYIFTQEQYKIFIEGSINIKIMFLENPQDKDIYSTEINKIISGFLPVQNELVDSLKPTLFIEEALVSPLTKNKFSLSLLIAMGIVVESENNYTKQHIKEPVKEYTKIIDTEENFKQAPDIKEETRYVNLDNIDLKDDVENEDPYEVDFKDEVENEDSSEVDFKDEVENEDSPKVDFKDEVENEDSPKVDFKDEVEYEDSPKVDFKDEVENEDSQDTDLKDGVVHEILEEINLDEVDENSQKVEFKDEIEDQNSQQTDFKGQLGYEPLQEVDSEQMKKNNNKASMEDKVEYEILEEEIFNDNNIQEGIDMEKLKQNSISIDVEYDMNSSQEEF
ncbi:RNA polymerase subunit sigma [Clostridium botulinum]|nr:RNA polymerase subunit sigma [Clostridium botulinum]